MEEKAFADTVLLYGNSMGRRTATTHPDASITSYYPSGHVAATLGSQTYPVYYAYVQEAGRLRVTGSAGSAMLTKQNEK